MKERSPDVMAMLQSIYSLVDLKDGGHMLDIGCGDGYDLWQISKLAGPECCFWGIDSRSKIVRAAQAEPLFAERFEFIDQDVSHGLPFDDDRFEVIFSKNVLECIPDKLNLLKEIQRVLKPDGQIVIAHYDWDSQTIDGNDKDFIRKLVHCFGDWQQDWMADSDAWMGRRLWATINGSRLFEGQIHSYVLTNTAFSPPYYGYERIEDFRSMAEKGLIEKEKYEAFYQEMTARSERGEYFYSITMYVYVGKKKCG